MKGPDRVVLIAKRLPSGTRSQRARAPCARGLGALAFVMATGCASDSAPARGPESLVTPGPAASPSAAAGMASAPHDLVGAPAAEVGVARATPREVDDASTLELLDHHAHHHHGGFVMFVAMSLDWLGGTPDQLATLKGIQTEMFAKIKPARDAEADVLTVLSDGIDRGRIDKSKVNAAIARLSSTAVGARDGLADSLNQLHARLTASQRAALVEKVDTHFRVWYSVNSDEEGGGQSEQPDRVARLAKEIGLTTTEVDLARANVRAKMADKPAPFDRKGCEAKLKAFSSAFASDTFDAKALTADSTATASIATWGAKHMALFYEAVAPKLTPSERTKLAESLRRHASYKRTNAGASAAP